MITFQETEAITSILFSPYNDLLAVATDEGFVRLLEIAPLPKQIKNIDKLFKGSPTSLSSISMQFPHDFFPYTDYDPQEFISKPPKIVFETKNAILQLMILQSHLVEH